MNTLQGHSDTEPYSFRKALTDPHEEKDEKDLPAARYEPTAAWPARDWRHAPKNCFHEYRRWRFLLLFDGDNTSLPDISSGTSLMLLHSPASPSVCALDKRVGVWSCWLGVSHLLYVCVRKLSSQRTLLLSSAGHDLVVPNPFKGTMSSKCFSVLWLFNQPVQWSGTQWKQKDPSDLPLWPLTFHIKVVGLWGCTPWRPGGRVWHRARVCVCVCCQQGSNDSHIHNGQPSVVYIIWLKKEDKAILINWKLYAYYAVFNKGERQKRHVMLLLML